MRFVVLLTAIFLVVACTMIVTDGNVSINEADKTGIILENDDVKSDAD